MLMDSIFLKERNETMADVEKLIDEISNMTVLELSELVKALEDKFGVSAAAAAPMMVAAGAEPRSPFCAEL